MRTGMPGFSAAIPSFKDVIAVSSGSAGNPRTLRCSFAAASIFSLVNSVKLSARSRLARASFAALARGGICLHKHLRFFEGRREPVQFR